MNAAVFFDFDGVIADSEAMHFRAFRQVLAPFGLDVSWTEYMDELIGFDDRDVIRRVHDRAGRPLATPALADMVAAKARAFAALAADEPPALYPGVRELISALRPLAALALCTGAVRSDIEAVVAATDLRAAFDVIVTADDVTAGKPDPAAYRLARRRVAALRSVEPKALRCVAIEDTAAGIAAARGAGMSVLAVATTHSENALRAADRIARDLASISAREVVEMARP